MAVVDLPTNINRDHLLKAIDKIDIEGIPDRADSHYYDVVFGGKRYPPKLVVSYGNLFANGTILDRDSFEGGQGTPCFRLIERNGFTIEKKINDNTSETQIRQMGYYPELKRFLEQAITPDLKTSYYIDSYQGLEVSVSFGAGNQARIPWIAFLTDGQTVQHGVYPVYLFFKEQKLLILAYGVSETNPPNVKWNLTGLKDISTYFLEAGLGKPVRYGKSFVFKVYKTDKALPEDEIDADLDALIQLYRSVVPAALTQRVDGQFNYKDFVGKCAEIRFVVSDKLCLRYISSLLTKPFVILTGLSGSGKTKLALSFAKWITSSEEQICVVPVGADWTNREPLLGYANALDKGRYVFPESGALQLILEASKSTNEHKPYFLILDEMNLSHVERYFADFLSVMESGESIKLHAENESKDNLPQAIKLPKNLFIVGTVNIDETTYMFSPKVLDRANVIEFHVAEDEMRDFLTNQNKLKFDEISGAGKDYAKEFMASTAGNANSPGTSEDINSALIEFFGLLKETGFEFGYRTATEIHSLAGVLRKVRPAISENEIIDIAIMQKLLPKIHGSRRKLEPILKSLGFKCLTDSRSDQELFSATRDLDISAVRYPLSLNKIQRMYKSLLDNGFTSYAEA